VTAREAAQAMAARRALLLANWKASHAALIAAGWAERLGGAYYQSPDNEARRAFISASNDNLIAYITV